MSLTWFLINVSRDINRFFSNIYVKRIDFIIALCKISKIKRISTVFIWLTNDTTIKPNPIVLALRYNYNFILSKQL